MEVETAECPVCGPAGYSVWMADGLSTRYVRCVGCRTVYASPRATRRERMSLLADEFGVGEFAIRNARSRRPVLANVAAITRRYVTRGRVLDVGCDLGDFFGFFAGAEWERHGVELSPSAARQAADCHDAHVRVGDLESAAWPDSWFDMAAMLDMLYYVDEPRALLREVARILRPGGVLAVEVPGQAWMLMRSRGLLCRALDGCWSRLRSDSCYVNWYTPAGLRRVVEGCGFRPLAFHAVGAPIGGMPIVRRVMSVHTVIAGVCAKVVPASLTWAPKVLLVASRHE